MEDTATATRAHGKPRPEDGELGFGRYTTDHMFVMNYDRQGGWRDAQIIPYQDLKLDPTAMVLHYNQQVFEGLKAYEQPDGGAALFRPDRHIERLNASARRMVYSQTLRVFEEATSNGYTQVLWLDAVHLSYVEEIGNSNSFFVFDDELVTPPLAGTILHGVVRDSVLQLARQWDLTVSERPVRIDEVVEGCNSGRLTEMFASGTAAVISPVGELCYRGENLQVADGRTGPLSKRLYDAITAIQFGRSEDTFGWLERVD